jgi:uncharacterized protein
VAEDIAPLLLEILVCPKCNGQLEPRIELAALDCQSCRLRYPIVDGIPVMIITEAVSTEYPRDLRPGP